mmetsp:Transcript_14140/g.24015  ORF Transcript_14140/g.24015 Transcript_14140/m.24015 type:complete len:87 (-) Transcript_14140:2186-2446(-)
MKDSSQYPDSQEIHVRGRELAALGAGSSKGLDKASSKRRDMSLQSSSMDDVTLPDSIRIESEMGEVKQVKETIEHSIKSDNQQSEA